MYVCLVLVFTTRKFVLYFHISLILEMIFGLLLIWKEKKERKNKVISDVICQIVHLY